MTIKTWFERLPERLPNGHIATILQVSFMQDEIDELRAVLKKSKIPDGQRLQISYSHSSNPDAFPGYRAPVETPLTNERIIEIAKSTDTAEPGRDGYILPVSFARAIEAEIIGHRCSTHPDAPRGFIAQPGIDGVVSCY